jgi:ComF family protein
MEAALRSLATWLAPARCAICSRPCRVAEHLCPRCAVALARGPGGLVELAGVGSLCWAAPYEGVARGLVAALKFGGRVALARVAAEAIATQLRVSATDAPWIVPVPAARGRARRRGFDPAELIAAALGRAVGLPVALPLVRVDRVRQAGRPRAARLADPPRIRVAGAVPARVLIVDDVATTGATLLACAAGLRAAGAEHVAAAVFARAQIFR